MLNITYNSNKITYLKLLILLLTICSCQTTKFATDESKRFSVKFLDEYIVNKDFQFQNAEYGGISGVDFRNDKNIVLVNDSPVNPIIYEAEFIIDNLKIDKLVFKNTIQLNDIESDFYTKESLDMESIRYFQDGFLISTEGNITKEKSPQIFKTSLAGEFEKKYNLPEYFQTGGENKPRHNGVFEGLSVDKSSKGFWFANELPLAKDGPKPKLINTNSPIRLSYFDLKTEQVTKQFAMDLDRVTKIPLLPFYLNGLTEILAIDEHRLLILERAYSAGHKSKGNNVKLFLVDVSKATDTKSISELKSQKNEISYAEKTLVFDFKSIKNKLTNGIIDNIEGLCFGPKLPNGNSTLILISDNNFNRFGKQLNQIILLEIKL
ncbi:esterase-like activity of phytase family protein [Psychroflexus aestuariivivens]|uniref:esterase-like activity of phytase family protein n=1 Tax=Psychroflexus aestuariivivens TaxID=1795040 RepID=UPI000FD7D4EE|nr:esterase-like activity of phytase family protein [Psychroflexus aestuariivivens]